MSGLSIGSLAITPGATGSGGSSSFIPYANPAQAALTVPSNTTVPNSTLINESTGIENKVLASQPSSTSNNSTNNSTSTNTSSTTSIQTPAQQAAAQKAAQIAAAISYETSNAIAAGEYGTSEQSAILGTTGSQYVANQKEGQNNIDLARTQIGTAQINSIKQLQDTIKNGLRGVGVQLGDSNALDSSAADEAARAYASYGNVQTNVANNTAATANEAQDVAQTNLDITSKADMDALNNARDAAIANIQGNAISALNNLGTLVSVYLQGDPSQINAPQIQQQIVTQAQNELNQVDQNYQNLINGINPMNSDQVATAAESASNAGVVPASGAPYNPVSSSSALSTPTSSPTSTDNGVAPPSLIPLSVNSKNQTTGG